MLGILTKTDALYTVTTGHEPQVLALPEMLLVREGRFKESIPPSHARDRTSA